MKKTTLAGLLLIVGFSALASANLRRSMTRYVTVPEARATADVVQVYGEIDQAGLRFDHASQEIHFPMIDLERNRMVVRYKGVRPGNMKQATHCVATGRWEGDHFRATSLLIKCPSKYQGEDAT